MYQGALNFIRNSQIKKMGQVLFLYFIIFSSSSQSSFFLNNEVQKNCLGIFLLSKVHDPFLRNSPNSQNIEVLNHFQRNSPNFQNIEVLNHFQRNSPNFQNIEVLNHFQRNKPILLNIDVQNPFLRNDCILLNIKLQELCQRDASETFHLQLKNVKDCNKAYCTFNSNYTFLGLYFIWET